MYCLENTHINKYWSDINMLDKKQQKIWCNLLINELIDISLKTKYFTLINECLTRLSNIISSKCFHFIKNKIVYTLNNFLFFSEQYDNEFKNTSDCSYHIIDTLFDNHYELISSLFGLHEDPNFSKIWMKNLNYHGLTHFRYYLNNLKNYNKYMMNIALELRYHINCHFNQINDNSSQVVAKKIIDICISIEQGKEIPIFYPFGSPLPEHKLKSKQNRHYIPLDDILQDIISDMHLHIINSQYIFTMKNILKEFNIIKFITLKEIPNQNDILKLRESINNIEFYLKIDSIQTYSDKINLCVKIINDYQNLYKSIFN